MHSFLGFIRPTKSAATRNTLLVLLVFGLLAGCSFGGQATPEAVDLPRYQPGATAASPVAVAEPATTTTTSAAAAPVEEAAARPGPTTAPATAPVADAPSTTGDAEQPTAPAPGDTAVAATPTAVAAVAAGEAAPVVEEAAATAAPAPTTLVGVYAAEIEASDEVVIVAEVSGQVLALTVEVGDMVQAGDVLARLDSTALEAQHMQAMAGLQAAQAQLNGLRNPPDEADLEAARAALAAARAGYNRAVAGPTEEERRQALAQLQQAQAAVSVAQAGYNLVRSVPEVGALPQGLQLQAATLGLEAAQAQYDKIIGGATQDQIAGAYAQVVSAQAQLQALQDGADPAQIRAAEAGVRSAENMLYLAQLQIANATIKAPVAGIVDGVQIQVGALAAPGAPVLTLLSPTVEVTIAVEEARLSGLRIGQPALLRVAAYPDHTFAGEVVRIAPELDPATRTVQVTIRPDDPDRLLRPGLSAQAQLYE